MWETWVPSLTLGRSPGEGNGNPLQYSFLKNSIDIVVWQDIVHGVTKTIIIYYLSILSIIYLLSITTIIISVPNHLDFTYMRKKLLLHKPLAESSRLTCYNRKHNISYHNSSFLDNKRYSSPHQWF